LSADKLATLVAQGDIGQNDLDVSKVYALGSVASQDRWYCHFYKRVNGSFGDSKAEKYSSWWITSDTFMNTAVEGGGIAFTFKPVNGDTGISATNVSKLNDNTTVFWVRSSNCL
jgi:hypothetical protein